MTYFADTSYYISALVPSEPHHTVANQFSSDSKAQVVTTAYILLELAAYFAKPPYRSELVPFVARLRQAPQLTIVPADDSLFDRGWAMYSAHADKSWSLTDCISFIVMHDRNIEQALTSDHHFEQAGFQIALKARRP